jgi:transposase
MKKRSNLATKYFFRIRDLEKKLRDEKKRVKEKEKQLGDMENELEKLKEQLKDKERKIDELNDMLFVPKRHKVSQKKKGAVMGKPHGAKGGSRPLPLPESIKYKGKATVSECPDCLSSLIGKECLSHKTIIEDINLQNTLQIREVSIFRKWCSHCRKFITGKHGYALPGQRLGNNILLFMMYQKYKNRLPYRKIAESLRSMYGMSVSHTELINLHRLANRMFQEQYRIIKKAIQDSKVIYADETGWRIEGKQGYVWVFDTKKMVLFDIRDTRGGGVPRKILGKKPDRITSADFYAGYNKVAGMKQRCWAHLIRKSKQLTNDYPKDRKVKSFHAKLKSIFADINAFRALDPPGDKQEKYQSLLRELESLSQRQFRQKAVNTLCKRIHKFKKELLTCVLHFEIDPTNNQAERAIRNMVLIRKISGGSRSKIGAKIFAENASVIQTADRTGNLMQQLRMFLLPA